MTRPEFELAYREGVHPGKVVGKKIPPPPVYTELRQSGLLIERNVPVRLRDGVRIFIDIYRPDGLADRHGLPTLLGWSPYGKHNTSDRLPWPDADVPSGWISPYTAFEAPDPLYWCRNGYAVVYPDPRGSQIVSERGRGHARRRLARGERPGGVRAAGPLEPRGV